MSVAPSGPIRFQRPAFPSAAAIEGYFSLARERRWFSNNGPCLHLLAERLSERTGASCLPVASGTLGLMVAAAAMRLRDGGDEAVVPSFTFPATAQAVLWSGMQ